jgi:hypothetical protein
MRIIIAITVFIFFAEKCVSQQIPFITITINDTIKKTHASPKRLKNDSLLIKKKFEKKIKISVNLKNNTDSTVVLYFFDNRVIPSHCNSNINSFNEINTKKIDDLYYLNCCGLRTIFYDSLNKIIKPQFSKSKLKRYNYFNRIKDRNLCNNILKKKIKSINKYQKK